jgi:drug/metabolite transporter (DMT)-like permease
MAATSTARDVRPEPMTAASSALALLAAALWGGNLVALKMGMTTFAPFWSAWWRFLLGIVGVAIWARSQGLVLHVSRRELRPLMSLATLFAVQISLLNVGTDYTSPAYGVVILNSYPVFSNLIGHFVGAEQRLNRARMLGLALALGGVCYLASGKPVERLAPNPLLGNSLLLASSFLLGVRTVYTRRLVQSIEPVKTVVWQMTLSMPFYLVPALVFEPFLIQRPTKEPVLAVLYQGLVVACICFVIWTVLLRRHSSGNVATFAFLVPLFGVALSAVFLHEPITMHILVATAMVTAGIAVVLRK